jgi:hypothetical protein
MSAESHVYERDRAPMGAPPPLRYWVKRDAYEFVLALPEAAHEGGQPEPPWFQLWGRGHARTHGLGLTLAELDAFYADLRQVMEFLRDEGYR